MRSPVFLGLKRVPHEPFQKIFNLDRPTFHRNRHDRRKEHVKYHTCACANCSTRTPMRRLTRTRAEKAGVLDGSSSAVTASASQIFFSFRVFCGRSIHVAAPNSLHVPCSPPRCRSKQGVVFLFRRETKMHDSWEYQERIILGLSRNTSLILLDCKNVFCIIMGQA